MRLVLFALLAPGLLACANPPEQAAGADTVAVSVHGPGAQASTFHVEVASDPPSRRRGLMHRTDLPDDGGMLFLFPGDTRRGFWMKDTPLPLTIAFADADGEIVAVLDMEPCAAGPCPTYRPGVAYRYALEVNRGALDGAEPGWRLEIHDDVPPAL